jgi:hypothetical protein
VIGEIPSARDTSSPLKNVSSLRHRLRIATIARICPTNAWSCSCWKWLTASRSSRAVAVNSIPSVRSSAPSISAASFSAVIATGTARAVQSEENGVVAMREV